MCAPADKTNLDGFEYWITIFNYQAPCGWSPIPPIEDVMQVCSPGHKLSCIVIIHNTYWGPQALDSIHLAPLLSTDTTCLSVLPFTGANSGQVTLQS